MPTGTWLGSEATADAGIRQELDAARSMQSDGIAPSLEVVVKPSLAHPGPAETAFSSPSTTASTSHTTATNPSSVSTELSAPESVLVALPPPYAHLSDVFPGHLPPPPLPLSTLPVHQRRRFSKPTMAGHIVKRSLSTPNVRGLATDAAALSYAAERRRNKLGYHRTSVACGHCRRRKIRCLLAPEDPQGRCSNCIRLKKECNFFPVDQPPLSDAKPGANKLERHSVGTAHSSSTSPSPPHPARPDPHRIGHLPPYAAIALPPGPHDYPIAVEHGPRTASVPSLPKHSVLLSSTPGAARPQLPHMQTIPPMPGPVEYGRPERPPGWDGSPYLDPSPMSNGGGGGSGRTMLEEPSHHFWRLAESPMTPAFSSSFAAPAGVPAIHRESVAGYPYAVARDDPGWHLQSRSMSFGQLEGLSLHPSAGPYPSPLPDYHHHHKHAAPPPPYPIPYGAGHLPDPAAGGAPDARGPAPAAYSMPPPPPWNPSFTANPMGAGPGPGGAKPVEPFGGWYPDAGRLAQVAEENTGPLNEEAPSYYPGTAQSAA
ncbi:MAG: hypothetical protein M1826_002152 [Phylliscum demangeonii]|nr:MAG: hypothetical protein M1826_002152 [Phylliscum demangeonii]